MSLRKTTLLLILHLIVLGESAFSATFSWHANSEASIVGYKIYYRTAFQTVPKMIDVGNRTIGQLSELEPETKYFCRLTAYNILGLESPPSDEIEVFTPPRTPSLALTSSGPQLNVSGRIGATWDLYQSADLVTWTINQTIVNTAESLSIPLPSDPSSPQMFYRLGYSGDSLAGWLAVNDLSDPAAQYPGTSVTNQVAYSMGVDLVGSPGAASPRIVVKPLPWQGGSANFVTFQFSIRESTRDVYPIVEASGDLKKWFLTDGLLVEESSELPGDGTRRITMREMVPISESAHGKRFYRLRFGSGEEPASPQISFAQWMAQEGATDPNEDYRPGISNSLAFASGADLLSNPLEALLRISTVEVGEAEQTVTHSLIQYRLRDNATSIEPVIEYTADLVTWQSAAEITSELSNTINLDGTRTISLRETDPVSTDSTRYYRVRYLLDE